MGTQPANTYEHIMDIMVLNKFGVLTGDSKTSQNLIVVLDGCGVAHVHWNTRLPGQHTALYMQE